jgi:hypothetical protein
MGFDRTAITERAVNYAVVQRSREALTPDLTFERSFKLHFQCLASRFINCAPCLCEVVHALRLRVMANSMFTCDKVVGLCAQTMRDVVDLGVGHFPPELELARAAVG